MSVKLFVNGARNVYIACMPNIPDWWLEIKGRIAPYVQDAPMPILVILVGFGSFGLGRMSALDSTAQPISIIQPAAVASVGQVSGETPGGQVMASKSGTKYHFPWCAGALQISEKNKIFFDSAESARSAGYTPAGNCKGLE